jgi:ribose-phosphate pyrophosphokinase
MAAVTSDQISLIAGRAHPEFAKAVAEHVGIPLLNARVANFPDREIDIKIHDDVRGSDCYVIQPTCPPVNDNWIELLLLADTLRRASAGRITAVMPYYGYARKDRKDEGRVPISAKVVANTLVASGVDRVLTVDMHAAQIQGFYDIPVDHLYAKPALLARLQELKIENPVVVTPDAGGVKMARAYAKVLGADLAIVDKRRISGSEIAVEHVIGDVAGRNVIIVDDMISTAGSITEAARVLVENGAKEITICVTHGVFCGPAVERLNACPAARILVTDTNPFGGNTPDRLEVVSLAPMVAQAIQNIHDAKSVSSLFGGY